MGNKLMGQALYAKALCAVIVRLSNAELEETLKKRGVDVSAVSLVIIRLLKQEHFTVQELSSRMMVSPPTLIPIIDSLEKKGFVKREIDSHDRRKNNLVLTAKGAGLIAKVPMISAGNRLVLGFERLGPKKSAELISLLEFLARDITGDDKMCAGISGLVFNNTQKKKKQKKQKK